MIRTWGNTFSFPGDRSRSLSGPNSRYSSLSGGPYGADRARVEVARVNTTTPRSTTTRASRSITVSSWNHRRNPGCPTLEHQRGCEHAPLTHGLQLTSERDESMSALHT